MAAGICGSTVCGNDGQFSGGLMALADEAMCVALLEGRERHGRLPIRRDGAVRGLSQRARGAEKERLPLGLNGVGLWAALNAISKLCRRNPAGDPEATFAMELAIGSRVDSAKTALSGFDFGSHAGNWSPCGACGGAIFSLIDIEREKEQLGTLRNACHL
jgi:hypothetical protein